MGDFEKVMRNVHNAEDAGYEIDDATARVIGSMYHSGQWTKSYYFISTGAIIKPTDLYRECFPVYETLSTDEKLMADMFGTYLGNRAERGPVVGWSKLWV